MSPNQSPIKKKKNIDTTLKSSKKKPENNFQGLSCFSRLSLELKNGSSRTFKSGFLLPLTVVMDTPDSVTLEKKKALD